jgi:catechol 2,3-dioxygenase-like lactoylglutathione lyase family enzyme
MGKIMAFDAAYDQTLSRRAMKAELLDAETELQLAYAWRDHRDEAALHRLITAYMRLAISMAAKFKRYGAPMNDLIQEAGLGLMKAADKFDPDRGVRFSTYAVWWIKASIQDYVMRNWSMVRTGALRSVDRHRSGRPARSLRSVPWATGLRAMIVPNLAVADLPRAVAFWCDVLGFSVQFVVGPDATMQDGPEGRGVRQPRKGRPADHAPDRRKPWCGTARGGGRVRPARHALSAWLGPRSGARPAAGGASGETALPAMVRHARGLYPRPGWAYPVPGRRGWPGAGIAAWGVGQGFLENPEKTEFSRKLWRAGQGCALAGTERAA